MRSLLLSFFSLSLLACGGSPDDAQAPIVDETPIPPPRTADETPAIPAPPASSSSPAASTAKDITGTVIDYAGAPVANASVTIVDAKGTKTVAKTDAAGAFVALAVVAPYDLSVLPSKSDPLFFFGLNTVTPQVRHDGATSRPPSTTPSIHKATIMTAIDFPTCPTAYCSAQIASGSKSGGHGREWTSFSGPAHRSDLIELVHEWTTSSPTDNVDVDVLLNDSSFTTYWHQKVETNALVKENQPIVTYAAAPTQMPLVGISIYFAPSFVPADWEKSTQVFLNLPGQPVTFSAQYTSGGNFITSLPSLPGATYSVSTSRSAPTVYDPVTNQRVHNASTSSTTGVLPLSTTTVDFAVVKVPSITSPAPLGKISRSSGTIVWENAPGRVAELVSYDAYRTYHGYTMGTSVSLAQLERLGIAVADGRHHLWMWTYPAASLGDALPPSAGGAPSRTDETVVFDVVP